MGYYLKPYTVRPGLVEDLDLVRLYGLREQGRRLYGGGLVRNTRDYNPYDFSLSRANVIGSGDYVLLSVGDLVAKRVARQLGWECSVQNFAPDWVFFCKEGHEGEKGPTLFTENWHIGSFSAGGNIGLWLQDADRGSLELVGSRSEPGLAYSTSRPPHHKSDKIQELAEQPENQIIRFSGNVCLDFPDNMCHRRQSKSLKPGEIRFGFRISN